MRTPRRGATFAAVVVAATIALAAAGCSSSDGGGDDASQLPSPTSKRTTSTTTTGPPVAEDPTFVPTDCWWPVPTADVPAGSSVTCGTVEVPSDRQDPNAEPIQLAVARFHREGSPPDAVPTVWLHGGPGGDALVAPPDSFLRMDSLDQRDTITFDQRGSGRSTPSLNCPEKEEAVLDALGAADSWAKEFAANRKAVQACYERLVADGVDPNDYDTPASVADLESIRRAFGLDQWNIWGASYGTRLGLAYAREHPDRVRSLLIDSVYPPHVGGVDRSQALPGGAIDRLAEACSAQASCEEAYGDLRDRLDAAVEAFDEKPEVVEGDVEVDGKTQHRTFTLTGSDVVAGMFAALYDSTLIPSLPGVIDGLASGDRSIIPAFVSTGVPRLIDLSEGAFYSTECADTGRLLDPVASQKALEDPGRYSLVALGTAEAFCADWPVDQVPASFNEPVTVDVPTLVYGGTLDPITPFAESKAQAERMPDARFVRVPNAGHGVAKFDDCTQQVRREFWADPSSKLPACAASIEGNTFTTS